MKLRLVGDRLGLADRVVERRHVLGVHRTVVVDSGRRTGHASRRPGRGRRRPGRGRSGVVLDGDQAAVVVDDRRGTDSCRRWRRPRRRRPPRSVGAQPSLMMNDHRRARRSGRGGRAAARAIALPATLPLPLQRASSWPAHPSLHPPCSPCLFLLLSPSQHKPKPQGQGTGLVQGLHLGPGPRPGWVGLTGPPDTPPG